MPGRFLGRGMFKHIGCRFQMIVPAFPVTPVFSSAFKTLMWCIFTRLKTRCLFLLGDCQPDFHNYRLMLDQALFKTVNFIISTLPFYRTRKPFYPFYQYPAIPGTVKNADIIIGLQLGPEAP